MRKNNKIIMGSIVALAVIVVLGIVYAAFTGQLTINGTATGRSSSWKIYFSRLTGPTLNGTAKQITAPTIKNNDTTIGDYSVTVTSPGDYIEYEFDVTNDGDYDATLTNLSINSASNLTYVGSGDNKTNDENNVKSQIEYTLKYKSDGTTVSQDDTLKSKETKTMLLRLTYKTFNDASLLPQADVAISGLGISLTYTQDGNAKVNADGTTPLITYDEYEVGDTVTIVNETYYVIEDSDSSKNYVTLLKGEPLTVQEVNTYGGVGTENNHVNEYIPSSYQGTAYDNNGYGSMEFFGNGGISYDDSEIKYVVDAWAEDKFSGVYLVEIDGYNARLITFEELQTFGYVEQDVPCGGCGAKYWPANENVPNWVYNSQYEYWTMSATEDQGNKVWWTVRNNGQLFPGKHDNPVVRPVINVYKDKITQS